MVAMWTYIVGGGVVAVLLAWELVTLSRKGLTWSGMMREFGKSRFVLVIIVWFIGYLMGHFWGCECVYE